MNGRIETSPEPLVEPLEGLSPVEAFTHLAHLPHVLFFDSAMQGGGLGRYSFVAADPVAWIERLPRNRFQEPGGWSPGAGSESRRFDSQRRADASQHFAGRCTVAHEPAVTGSAGPLAELANLLADFTTSRIDDLPTFQGGAAGLFGYDLVRGLEDIRSTKHDEFQVPALAVGLYDVVVAFDHVDGSAWLISQGLPEHDPAARRRRAARRLGEFRELLGNTVSGGIQPHEDSPSPPASESRRPCKPDRLLPNQLCPQFSAGTFDQLTSNFSRDDYLHTVSRVIEYIHAGDVFQVNLSQRLLHPATSDSVSLYLRLRERNAAPFAAFLDIGKFQIISASPERFLRVDASEVETRPIKGTRPRMLRPEADLFSGDELRHSEKDRAENVMIVDLLRNDLSRVCLADSVQVTELCELETYAYVQHLVSTVHGRLQPGCTPIDLLQASFPGGSITGAPKIRAMEIIAELESTARGAYCGSLGYIGLDGTMDTSILIRTITAGRGWWQLPVGGGIVAQSDPHAEYDETWHKAEGMLRALR